MPGLPLRLLQFRGGPNLALRDLRGRITPTAYEQAILADGPVGYWRLGEGPGSIVAHDSSGHGYHGVYTNTPTLGVPGVVNGETNTAVTLNGTDEYILLPESGFDPANGPLSIEWWQYRASDKGVESKIFDKAGTGAVQITENGTGTVVINQAGGATIVSAATTDTIGSWFYYVYTKNGSTSHLYRNAVEVTGTVTDQVLTTSPAGQWAVGVNRGLSGAEFPGSLDELAFYTTVLSPAQILAHYQAANVAFFVEEPEQFWRVVPTYLLHVDVDQVGIYPPLVIPTFLEDPQRGRWVIPYQIHADLDQVFLVGGDAFECDAFQINSFQTTFCVEFAAAAGQPPDPSIKWGTWNLALADTDTIQPPAQGFDPSPYADAWRIEDACQFPAWAGWPIVSESWPEALPPEIPFWISAAEAFEPRGATYPAYTFGPEEDPVRPTPPDDQKAAAAQPEPAGQIFPTYTLGEVQPWPEAIPTEIPFWWASAELIEPQVIYPLWTYGPDAEQVLTTPPDDQQAAAAQPEAPGQMYLPYAFGEVQAWPEALPAELPLWATAAQPEPAGPPAIPWTSGLDDDGAWITGLTTVYDPSPYADLYSTDGGYVWPKWFLSQEIIFWPEALPAEIPFWVAAELEPEAVTYAKWTYGPDAEQVLPTITDGQQAMAAQAEPAGQIWPANTLGEVQPWPETIPAEVAFWSSAAQPEPAGATAPSWNYGTDDDGSWIFNTLIQPYNPAPAADLYSTDGGFTWLRWTTFPETDPWPINLPTEISFWDIAAQLVDQPNAWPTFEFVNPDDDPGLVPIPPFVEPIPEGGSIWAAFKIIADDDQALQPIAPTVDYSTPEGGFVWSAYKLADALDWAPVTPAEILFWVQAAQPAEQYWRTKDWTFGPDAEQMPTPTGLLLHQTGWAWVNPSPAMAGTRSGDWPELQDSLGSTRSGDWPELQDGFGRPKKQEGER